MSSNSAATARAEDVLEIVRTFAAPRELVFRMWSRPEFIVRWWGPEGTFLANCEMDFRVGGSWRYTMQSVSGARFDVCGVYREIIAPSRLCFTYGPDEPDGFETLVEIELIDRGAETEMRFRQGPFTTDGMREAHGLGWSGTFGLLDAYLRQTAGQGGEPAGAPRGEGVAPDIVAARARMAAGGPSPEQHALDLINNAGR